MKFGKTTRYRSPKEARELRRNTPLGYVPNYGRINKVADVLDTAYKSGQVSSPDLVDTLHPRDKGIKIYLDDERPVPQGWTLAKTHKAFFDLLKQGDEFLNEVTHISLDWYLGSDRFDGMDVAKDLSYMFFEAFHEERVFLPQLKQISFHSSDPEQARRMRTVMAEVLGETEKERAVPIRLRLGSSVI